MPRDRAALQEFAAPLLPSSAPRLPLALGLLALVYATRHLDPRGLVALRRIAPVAFVPLYLATLFFPTTSLTRFTLAHILTLWLWVRCPGKSDPCPIPAGGDSGA